MGDCDDKMAQTPWQLDKRVPLALIIAILAQTAGGVWFAAKQDARVEALETKANFLAEQDRSTTRSIGDIRETLAATKPTLENMAKTLERIERQLDGERK